LDLTANANQNPVDLRAFPRLQRLVVRVYTAHELDSALATLGTLPHDSAVATIRVVPTWVTGLMRIDALLDGLRLPSLTAVEVRAYGRMLTPEAVRKGFPRLQARELLRVV
jgi:hypothetical protein